MIICTKNYWYWSRSVGNIWEYPRGPVFLRHSVCIVVVAMSVSVCCVDKPVSVMLRVEIISSDNNRLTSTETRLSRELMNVNLLRWSHPTEPPDLHWYTRHVYLLSALTRCVILYNKSHWFQPNQRHSKQMRVYKSCCHYCYMCCTLCSEKKPLTFSFISPWTMF